jgi:hypothetical protein
LKIQGELNARLAKELGEIDHGDSQEQEEIEKSGIEKKRKKKLRMRIEKAEQENSRTAELPNFQN